MRQNHSKVKDILVSLWPDFSVKKSVLPGWLVSDRSKHQVISPRKLYGGGLVVSNDRMEDNLKNINITVNAKPGVVAKCLLQSFLSWLRSLDLS